MQSTLADRIRHIIRQQNIKQTEFAKALGITANYVTLLVTARKKAISVTLAKLIESTYGYSAGWILNGELPEKINKNIDLTQQTINRIMQLDAEKIGKVLSFVETLDNVKE